MLKDYLGKSRAPRYSILFALPLLLFYEGLSALLTGSAVEGVRNGADVLLKSLFLALGGRDGLVVFGVALLLVGAVLVWSDRRRAGEPLEPRIFGFMLAESALYATLFGFVVGWLTTLVLNGPRGLSIRGGLETLDLPTQLVVSLGAGIYEELVFRVVLVGALLWGMRVVLGTGKTLSTIGAVALSALLFSAFHYMGELGNTFTVASFTFRAIAGVLFSLLYVARGFGIAAWTHALYDLGLSMILQVSGGSGQ